MPNTKETEVLSLIETYVEHKKHRSRDKHDYHTYSKSVLYCDTIDNKEALENTMEYKDSCFHFFNVLATTSRNSLFMNRDYLIEMEDGTEKSVQPSKKGKRTFGSNIVFLFLELLNIASFVRGHIELQQSQDEKKRKQTQKDWMQIFVVAANIEFGNLISHRAKNQFAYYFHKMLLSHTKGQKVTPYKNSSWQKEFAAMRQDIIDAIALWKSNKSLIEKDGINSLSFPFGNIVITIGEMLHTSETESWRPFIEIGILESTKHPDPHYNRIFFTDF